MNSANAELDTVRPPTDIKQVLDEEIKEWHFHIYFLQNNDVSKGKAIQLRDAILSLRKDGAFVAVPLFRVNYGPMGPHPIGSYEVWCPIESFASVFSYLTLYRDDLSVLVHPLTREEKKDHEIRRVWMGQPYGIDLSVLPVLSEEIPFQYASLKLGYNTDEPRPNLELLRERGRNIEEKLAHEPEAAVTAS
ncbi:hypothetical protein DL93DRAFT_2059562 [Clavulina sp. PMI_390]|nr:hypothetical protein DL93DRAFT_2059562 [Clavulina sp. PMI_390]